MQTKQAQGRIATRVLERHDDVRLKLIQLWPQIERQFPERITSRRWSKDINFLTSNSHQLAVQEFSLNVISVNIALLLAQVGQLNNPLLIDLSRVDPSSSLHLEYRQGFSIIAQRRYLLPRQIDDIEQLVELHEPESGVVFALVAQIGQLGRVLSGARSKMEESERYLITWAETRMGLLAELAKRGGGKLPEERPATIDIIGALSAIAAR